MLLLQSGSHRCCSQKCIFCKMYVTQTSLVLVKLVKVFIRCSLQWHSAPACLCVFAVIYRQLVSWGHGLSLLIPWLVSCWPSAMTNTIFHCGVQASLATRLDACAHVRFDTHCWCSSHQIKMSSFSRWREKHSWPSRWTLLTKNDQCTNQKHWSTLKAAFICLYLQKRAMTLTFVTCKRGLALNSQRI